MKIKKFIKTNALCSLFAEWIGYKRRHILTDPLSDLQKLLTYDKMTTSVDTSL